MANAGVNTITPSGEVREAEYDTQFGINARGTFFGVQAIAPHLQERASIILVGSLASDKVLDGHAVYAGRAEEHTSELQSLMRISYAVFRLKQKHTYKVR